MKDAMPARSITIAIQGVAIIGLAAAVVFTARSAETAAAAAATLIQNVDEPARNLYQQQVTVTDCYACTLQFSAVPAGKTLRITQASCYMEVGDTNGVTLVSIYSGTGVSKEQFISSAAQGNASVVVANSGVNLYSSAGSKPYAYIDANTGEITNATCTFSGYFVTN